MSTLRSRSSRCVRRFSSRSHLTHHVAPHQGSLPGTLPTGWGQQLWLHCFANGINPLSTGPRSHSGAIAAIAPRLGGMEAVKVDQWGTRCCNLVRHVRLFGWIVPHFEHFAAWLDMPFLNTAQLTGTSSVSPLAMNHHELDVSSTAYSILFGRLNFLSVIWEWSLNIIVSLPSDRLSPAFVCFKPNPFCDDAYLTFI